MSTRDAGVPYPPPITVVLKGQMSCGGILQIDANGVVNIHENLPNDRNQCTFHEMRMWKGGKSLVRFQCTNHPTKYLTGNEYNYEVHGEPTLSDGDLSDDSEWEIRRFTIIKEDAPCNWIALYHPRSCCYFVIMRRVGNDSGTKLVFELTNNPEEVKEYGAFTIEEIYI